MESPYHGGAPVSHGGASRPSLGFPLGTALLLVVIFSLSGLFSCCYHRDKLRRALSLDLADLEADGDLGPAKPKPPHMHLKQQENQSLSVIMPGDKVPKFIALPCPCEPLREEKSSSMWRNCRQSRRRPPCLCIEVVAVGDEVRRRD